MPDDQRDAAGYTDNGLPDKCWWFIFVASKLLTGMNGGSATVPFIASPEELGLTVARKHHIGTIAGVSCFAVEAGEKTVSSQVWKRTSLRSLYGVLPDDFFKMAMVAVHVLQWDNTMRFCGRCGASLNFREDLRVKECPACERLIFPRISPAVIVLIERGDQLLLARNARFTEPMYSVLAGFVEPGENLEDTVRREVKEEVGITVKDVRYFGSQPWPFPDSLMIGFTATYKEGEIAIDGEEIAEARWFRYDELPPIPGPISIARQLIDWFVEKHRKDGQQT